MYSFCLCWDVCPGWDYLSFFNLYTFLASELYTCNTMCIVDVTCCMFFMQDIGCGIGGPARVIARYSGASVTGLNICDYQLTRAQVHTEKSGLKDLVSFVKASFSYSVYVCMYIV